MNCSINKELPNGEVIYDGRHNPVISRALLKDNTSVTPGAVLKVGTDGLTVEPATAATDTPFAVALEGGTGKDGSVYINVLMHGTVKKELITLGGSAITAPALVKLNSIGIYA